MGITALLEGVCDQSHCPAEITHEVVEALLWPYYGHISRGGGCAYRALGLGLRGMHFIYLNKPCRSDSSPFIPIYSFWSGSYTSSDILWSWQITGGCSLAVKRSSAEGGITHCSSMSWVWFSWHVLCRIMCCICTYALYICSASLASASLLWALFWSA